jgi:hypothetical protein
MFIASVPEMISKSVFCLTSTFPNKKNRQFSNTSLKQNFTSKLGHNDHGYKEFSDLTNKQSYSQNKKIR